MASANVIRVALDTPLRRLFDYLPPEELASPILPGMRVRVPFGRQRLVGVVMENTGSSDLPPEKLKRILEVLDSAPVLDEAGLGILRWAADYYHHPIGEALATAMPKALRLGANAQNVREMWAATAAGIEAFASGEPKRATKQRKLLGLLVDAAQGAVEVPQRTAAMGSESGLGQSATRRGPANGEEQTAADHWLATAGEQTAADHSLASTGKQTAADHSPASIGEQNLAERGVSTSQEQNGAVPNTPLPALSADELTSALPGWRDTARALAQRGWVISSTSVDTPGSASTKTRVEGPELSDEQRIAVEAVGEALDRFGVFVLHGVTGSGKTEVYLRLVDRVLRQGKRALVLVPEIGLTPQLVGRFRDRFEAPLAVLHSALTDNERLEAWRDAYSGHAHIVLGTRSAVFAPVPNIGLIIIDEEHDSSFKQHEGGFRYSARDLAVVRAQRAGVPIMLGSATPALETLHNIWKKRYVRLSLPRRASQAAPPKMSLIDLRAHTVRSAISNPAAQAIERHLKDDGQVLVFLNRRGYAPTLLCTACGWIAPCKDCDARLTVHQSAHRLRCHHCGADQPLPERCPTCGFLVKSVGQGTERVEETLGGLFPGISLVRLDRDVVRKRGDMESAMQRMASGEGRILIGTQMVTKGHDFPNVTLVVVLNADQGLFSTDFRASERLAQMIVQVAGRAGRGTKPGEVLIQTEYPDHPLLQSLLKEGYEGFARTALTEREQTAWPPFSRLAAVRDSAESAENALTFLTEARKAAAASIASSNAGTPFRVRLLGPVPAAMAKRAGRYHAQLLVESPERGDLHHFLDAWLADIEQLPSSRKVRWALDVDPIELF